jgi:hypothetical protein
MLECLMLVRQSSAPASRPLTIPSGASRAVKKNRRPHILQSQSPGHFKSIQDRKHDIEQDNSEPMTLRPPKTGTAVKAYLHRTTVFLQSFAGKSSQLLVIFNKENVPSRFESFIHLPCPGGCRVSCGQPSCPRPDGKSNLSSASSALLPNRKLACYFANSCNVFSLKCKNDRQSEHRIRGSRLTSSPSREFHCPPCTQSSPRHSEFL